MIIKDNSEMNAGLGPFLGRFPTEIVLEIFKWTIVFEHATATPFPRGHPCQLRIANMFHNGHPHERYYTTASGANGKIITKSRFDYFMALTLLDKLSVSKTFRSLIQELLYTTNAFSFSPVNSTTMLGNRLSPQLPPLGLRHHLRRIQIELHLEDFYMPAPRHLVPWEKEDFSYNRITTVDNLLVFCPGARTLRNLTDANIGCSKLKKLEITIILSIKFEEDDAVRLWRAAEFSVEAQEVDIKFKANNLTNSPAQQWHSTLIRVNLRE